DDLVTGVQTCALPISRRRPLRRSAWQTQTVATFPYRGRPSREEALRQMEQRSPRSFPHHVTREIACRFHGRKRILPIDVVVAHWPEKREPKIQDRLYRRRYHRPASLLERRDRREEVSVEVA